MATGIRYNTRAMSTRTHPFIKTETPNSLSIFDRILKNDSIVSIFNDEVLRIFQRYCVKEIARDIRIAIPKAFERSIDAVEIYVCDFGASVAQFKSPEHDATLVWSASLPSRYWKSNRCDTANTRAIKAS